MTSPLSSIPPSSPLGETLKRLRGQRGLPLRVVAPAAKMDAALLSKIEKGIRLPTRDQTAALAGFFGLPVDSLEAVRLAEKFWRENGDNPAAARAASLIEEAGSPYRVNKSPNNLGRTSPSNPPT